MMRPTQTETLCSLGDRVTNTKMDNFVEKLSSSLDAIQKTLQSFKATAETLQKPQQNFRMQCSICNRTNHNAETCFFKHQSDVQNSYQHGQYRNYRGNRGGRYQRRGYPNLGGQRNNFPQQQNRVFPSSYQHPRYWDSQMDRMQHNEPQQMYFNNTGPRAL